MISYIVNGKRYSVRKITLPRDQTCGSRTSFYTSDLYFIKETPKRVYFCGSTLKTIEFYHKYYIPGVYSAPKLIDYQVQNLKIKLVFEKLYAESLGEIIKANYLDPQEGREMFIRVLETIIPFEKNHVEHGDLRLKNILVNDEKTYLIDFDFLGRKQNIVNFIASTIYDFENSHKTGKFTDKIADLDFSTDLLSPDLEEYHPCCRDVAAAILNNEITSAQDALDLINKNDKSSSLDYSAM